MHRHDMPDIMRRISTVFRTIPALVPAIAIIAGIYTAIEIGGGYIPAITALIISPVLWLLKRPVAATGLFMFSAGVITAEIHRPVAMPGELMGKEIYVSGRVDAAREKPHYTEYFLENVSYLDNSRKWATLPGVRLKVYAYNSPRMFACGDEVIFNGRCSDVHTTTYLPDETDFGQYARAEGVASVLEVYTSHGVITASSPSLINRLSDASIRWLDDAIIHAGFDRKTTAFITAAISGDNILLDETTRENLRISGAAHLIAISGMHVAIILLIISIILKPLRLLRGGRALYFMSAICGVLWYALATGLSPSAARAAVMAAVALIAVWMNRGSHPVNTLCVTIVFWLLIRPMWLWSVGMHLSVAAVAGILIIGLLLLPRRTMKPKVLRTAIIMIVIPLAAFIGTCVPSMAYFNTLPAWFFPVSIISGLLAPAIIGLAAIALLINAIGLTTIGHGIASAVSVLYSLLDRSTEYFADLGRFSNPDIYPEWWQILLAGATVVLIAISVRIRRWPVILATITVAIVTTISICHTAETQTYGYETHIVSLCRHPGILVRKDTTATLYLPGSAMTDSAAIRTNIDSRYVSYMRRRGIQAIRLVPAEDLDINGLRYIFADKPIDSIAMSNHGMTYLIVTSGFTGDITKTVHAFGADTVLLSARLHPVRHNRLARELSEAGIPFQSMRKQ